MAKKMRIIDPSYEILTRITGDELGQIEKIARTCYKSEDKITGSSTEQFITTLIKNKHEAMLEHSILSVKFICDRGISHELVRHRLASFAQESTRYCNYSLDKFGSDLTFIRPFFLPENSEGYVWWASAMQQAEVSYMELIKCGATPQEARTVLPNSIKTEVIMTANYREWRHFFQLRAARSTGPAHPQMEELTIPLLKELRKKIPVIFEDIYNSIPWVYLFE